MLNILLNILIFILVLGVLIFIHELGHFLAAKISKVKVYEFALGLGPKLFSFIKGGVEFRLNILPIGGYVKILGEGDEVVDKKLEKSFENLKNKPKYVQIFVMLAGIMMNILLAASIYFFFIVSADYKWPVQMESVEFEPVFGEIVVETMGPVKYEGLVEGNSAQKAGLPDEGEIRSLNGEELERSDELVKFLVGHKGEIITLNVCADECVDYEVEVSDDAKIGIYLPQNYRAYISYESTGILSGFAHSINVVQLIGEQLSGMFSSAQKSGDYSQVVNSVSGPVGIYVIIDHFKAYGWQTIVGLIADFSLTLAVMNALPIPALDGGRVLLIVVELIRGKPLDKKLEAAVINISFLLLLLLMVVVVFKDIFTIDQLRSLLK